MDLEHILTFRSMFLNGSTIRGRSFEILEEINRRQENVFRLITLVTGPRNISGSDAKRVLGKERAPDSSVSLIMPVTDISVETQSRVKSLNQKITMS